MNHDSSLVEILTETAWFSNALNAVNELNAPCAYIGSGAIRNAVWDSLHDCTAPSYLADIDVVYFDRDDLSEETEHRYEEVLRGLEPDHHWDVKNQAAVHLWFHKVFGHRVDPLDSIEDAVATWPETACCVAVRMRSGKDLEVVAPLGLDDLFAMVVRRNPRRVTIETYHQRIKDKQYTERWPRVRVVQESES